MHDFLRQNLAQIEAPLSDSNPWRPVITTLYAVGGNRVQAIHLNAPVDDGLPDLRHLPSDGLDVVLQFCDQNDIKIVLEPESESPAEIRNTIQMLREYS